MPVTIGDTAIGGVYVGDTAASKVYLGDTQVWAAFTPFTVVNTNVSGSAVPKAAASTGRIRRSHVSMFRWSSGSARPP